jgi:anaerobic selenocysteine-containing dehydrogenase
MCGLAIEVKESSIGSLRGNRDDVFSKGAFCPKSQGLRDLLEDPDRVRKPLKKVDGRFVPISWKDAFTEISAKINAIQKKYGASSVATYSGNPNAHHFGNLVVLPLLLKALRTPNKYSATSVDQLPHMLVSYLMYGHQLLLPIADIDRARFILMFGANPAVSNGSILSAPGLSSRLKALGRNHGKFVLFDPRYTETASVATEHHFIRPGTDGFLLAALLHLVLKEKAPRLGKLADTVKNFEEACALFASIDITRVEKITGVSGSVMESVASELLDDKPSIVYGRMGVSTQKYGVQCQWMINLLNIITGNCDREGGVLFTKPAIDIIGLSTKLGSQGSFRRRYSRVHQLPEFAGELPVATLADEILTPGKGQVKALITVAGNPVLSTPDGRKLEKALGQLELMVALDFYQNETTGLAHYILPPTTSLEQSHFDLIFNALATRNIVRYSPAVVPPPQDAYEDWEIILELWSRIGPNDSLLQKFQKGVVKKTLFTLGLDPLLDIGLRRGPYGAQGLNLRKIKAHPDGIDLGPLKPSLPDVLATKDKKIDLYPSPLRDAWDIFRSDSLWEQDEVEEEKDQGLFLIGRRGLKSNNSWMHNLPSLSRSKDPCFVLMHPIDASKRQIEDGSRVRVTSSVGSLELPVQITERIMPGVISIPHGFGHHRPHAKLSLASQVPGQSINDIIDGAFHDLLTGNAVLNGQKVQVVAVSS